MFDSRAFLILSFVFSLTLVGCKSSLEFNELAGRGNGQDIGSGGDCSTEIPGNGIDDDCDSLTDEIEYSLKSGETTASDIQGYLDTASSGSVLEFTADGPITIDSTLVVTTSDLTLFTVDSDFEWVGSSLATILSIEADNIVLDGLALSNSTGDLIYQATPQSGTTLKNVNVSDAGDECVQFRDCASCLFENVYVKNCTGDGLNVDGGSNLTIDEASIDNSTSTNGYLQLASLSGTVSISDLEIKNCPGTGAGILLYKNSSEMTFSDIFIHDSDVPSGGIDMYKHQSTDRVTVQNSEFSNNTGEALFLQKEVGIDSDFLLDSSTLTNNSAGIVSVVDSQICTIQNTTGSGNNGETSTTPCTDGGGNTLSP